MKNSFELFQNLKEKHLIQTLNPNFNEIFYDFSFFFIDEDKINENLKKQRLIIIDEYEHSNAKYYIICFKKTLITMNEKDIKNNIDFFKIIQISNIYLFKDQTSRNIFEQDRTNDPNKYNFILFDSIKKEEILKFQKEFLITNRNIIDFWKTISRSISGFLIGEAYENTFIDRVMKTKKLIQKKEEKEMNHNEYISIKTINSTATSIIEKIYHLKERKYYIKKKKRRTIERVKLSQREYYNYMQFHHPFQLQFYSAIEEENQETLILEYIEGETLENIQKMRLTIADKYKIIFEIILIINYCHHHRFVYRDLKPNNVMLDRNKTIILIDLDRMISEDEIANKNEEDTTIIIHQYSSPELKEGKLISYSTDIYSLGMLMFYLIFEKEPSISKIEETKCQPILVLIKRCTRENPKERPNIIEVLKYFYVEFFSKVRNELIETDVINNIKNIDNDIYIEYKII